MPTTDHDGEIVASMPPGTRVIHAHGHFGVVIDGGNEPSCGQILVRFDNGSKSWCYPINLERAREGQ